MPQTDQIVRIFANILTAINFGVIAVALIVFLRRQDIGHRPLLRMIVVFCLMITGDHVLGLYWNLTRAHTETFALLRLGTAVYGSMCVTYFTVTNRDLLRTLRISEFWDRARKGTLAEREQARQQIVYASRQTRVQSEAILARSKS